MMYGGSAGTGHAPSPREASDTPRMIEHLCPLYTWLHSLLAEALSLRFNQKGFCDGVKPIAKPPAFAPFTVSGGRFDGRVAFRSAREAAFGSPGRPTAGFRCLRRRAHVRQKRRNRPMDPYGRQPTRIVTALPRQPQVRDTLARQP